MFSKNSQVTYTALYNSTGVHTLPVIINKMSESILSLLLDTRQTLKTTVQRWPSNGNLINIYLKIIILSKIFTKTFDIFTEMYFLYIKN